MSQTCPKSPLSIEEIEGAISSIEWRMSDIRTAMARGLNADRAMDVELDAAALASAAKKLARAAAALSKAAKSEAYAMWLSENEAA